MVLIRVLTTSGYIDLVQVEHRVKHLVKVLFAILHNFDSK